MSQQKQKVRCGKCGYEHEQGLTECPYCHAQLCPTGHVHLCKNTASCMRPDYHACDVCLTTWVKKLPSYLPPREFAPEPEKPSMTLGQVPVMVSASGAIDNVDESGR